jgi:hypothetical protein
MGKFQIGDYVHTSQGKTGIIVEPSKFIVGCYENGEWVELFWSNSLMLAQQKMAETLSDRELVIIEKACQVQLGSKIVEIKENNLTIATILSFRIANSNVIHLPVEDARIVLETMKHYGIPTMFA